MIAAALLLLSLACDDGSPPPPAEVETVPPTEGEEHPFGYDAGNHPEAVYDRTTGELLVMERFDDPDEPPPPEAVPRAARQRPVPEKDDGSLPRWLEARLHVNEHPHHRLASGMPLLLRFTYYNELERPMRLHGLDRVQPEVRNASGGKVAVSWTRLTSPPTDLDLDGTVFVQWSTTDTLAPGTYQLHATVPQGFVSIEGVDEPPPFEVAVSQLEILNEDPDPIRARYWQRRFLAVGGQTEAWTAAIERELAGDPDNLALWQEMVDALTQAGRREEARTKLMELIGAVQDKQQQANPDQPPQIPDFLIFQLEALQHEG